MRLSPFTKLRLKPTSVEADLRYQIAIRDQERAGIDIVSDGEVRRESYVNRGRGEKLEEP